MRLYFDKYVRAHAKSEKWTARLRRFCERYVPFLERAAEIEIAPDVDDAAMDRVAGRTEKFSGREIDKLMLAVQAVIYGSDRCFVDAKILAESVDFLIKDQRKKWQLLSKKTVWS